VRTAKALNNNIHTLQYGNLWKLWKRLPKWPI